MNLELLRYIMAGICTTFVNLGVFSIFKIWCEYGNADCQCGFDFICYCFCICYQ